jgi:hypothetical protein
MAWILLRHTVCVTGVSIQEHAVEITPPTSPSRDEKRAAIKFGAAEDDDDDADGDRVGDGDGDGDGLVARFWIGEYVYVVVTVDTQVKSA